jgi:hypothetical protein
VVGIQAMGKQVKKKNKRKIERTINIQAVDFRFAGENGPIMQKSNRELAFL